jgi:hypothetical protein
MIAPAFADEAMKRSAADVNIILFIDFTLYVLDDRISSDDLTSVVLDALDAL